MTEPAPAPTLSESERRDLGFGTALTSGKLARLLNRDGSFTARRSGLGIVDSNAVYHYLVTTTWPRFMGWIILAYGAINLIFMGIFLALGPDALAGGTATTTWDRVARAFFFSVDTVATIGYGNISPATLAANLVVTAEALVGLVGVSIMAGIVFARVSRPAAGFVFSEVATIGPYRGGTALMFRLANARRNEVIQVRANVTVAINRSEGARGFHPLRLERDDVVFLPTSWTVVHPIDADSPLYGLSRDDLLAAAPEVFVLLTATEEDFFETVHARTSYVGSEIVWGARFKPILRYRDGVVQDVDIGRLGEVESVPLPVA